MSSYSSPRVSLPDMTFQSRPYRTRQYNTGRYSSLSGQVMGHHKKHATESAARTDSATASTILTLSFPLPQRSARIKCPCISKYFIAGSITGLQVSKPTREPARGFALRDCYTRVRMTVRLPGLLYASWLSGVINSYLAGIGGFIFQCYR